MKNRAEQSRAEQSRAEQSRAEQTNYKAGENRVKCLGFIEKGTGKHQSNCVYSIMGLSPTICAGLGVKMPGLYIVVKE